MFRRLILIILFFSCSFSLWSASVITDKRIDLNEYDSIPMLEKYFGKDDDMQSGEEQYWSRVKISLVTVTKGDEVYSYFGHQALMIEYPDGTSFMVDYGQFAFSPDFYVNFAMGRLWYWCSASSVNLQLSAFVFNRRTATAVELNLTPKQKKAVIDFLYQNISEESRTYMYHYYRDNCATRIRDIIDYALDGKFREWAEKEEAYTFREETSRMLSNNIFWFALLDFLQGRNIDVKNTLWDSMFLPENLEKAVLKYPGLSSGRSYLVDSREVDVRPSDAEKPCNLIILFLSVGVALACLMFFLHFKAVKIYNILTSIFCFISGILGLLLFFIMFFTIHDVAWWNENILFINPLLLVVAFFTVRSSKHGTALKRLWFFFMVSILLLIFAKIVMPSTFIQKNMAHILLMLPVYSVNFYIYFFSEKKSVVT